MANKQYLSIIRLFNHCGISTANDFNLRRAKKQLRAEFQISQGGFIEVDGYSYTSHDVFEEIERPDFLKRLDFHEQIWNSPQILQLLETNVANLSTIDVEFVKFWSNTEFDEFFSPYFVNPFNYLSRTFLANNKMEEAGTLLFYEGFLQPDDREEAFRPIRVYLDENFRTLRNVNRQNYDLMRPKIVHWITTKWHLFFNNLPDEFYALKNEMARYIVNIGVYVQQSHRRDCRRMSTQLVALTDTSESLRSTIISNHAIYNRSRGIGWGKFRVGSGFGLFWLLFVIIRAATGNGCNDDTPNYQQYKIQTYPYDSSLMNKLQRQADSTIHLLPTVN